LNTRYKCRVRKPWYKVPSVYTAPIAMLKRAHHFPRMILNRADAYTTDTAYRISPKGIQAESLVYSFLKCLTCLNAELEGRHYGCGGLELVPSEIERLLVPIVGAGKAELRIADEKFRQTEDRLEFLQAQDAAVLAKIGLNKKNREILFNAWLKLRDRRQRLSSATPADDAGE